MTEGGEALNVIACNYFSESLFIFLDPFFWVKT